jgi:catechol 2,3-dioxygenase-like lactoylglutathione lyase family enzyme
MATLDHLILNVNDLEASVSFYTEVMGFADDGDDGPFRMIRIGPDSMILLAPWGSEGGEHLAFALASEEFAATFGRIKAAGVPYGDSYHDVGNMRGPGDELGARGGGPTVYVFDPSQHLIEIRSYQD